MATSRSRPATRSTASAAAGRASARAARPRPADELRTRPRRPPAAFGKPPHNPLPTISGPHTMSLRPLGRSSLLVSPLCFGGNVFGWTADEKTSFSLLDAWLDAGFNFVDTADVYSRWAPGHSGGESETVIGKWLQHSGKRSKLVLATK